MLLTFNHRKQCRSSKYRPQYEPQPRAAKRMSQHHSHCRPQYLCLPSSTRKSTYWTSTDIESFINVWTLCKMMLYVSSFLSNFIDSILCLGFTHDVVYCSTLFIYFYYCRVWLWMITWSCTDPFYWQYKSELFPVLDYYKCDTTTYHDNFFGCKYVLLTFHV